MAESLIRGVTQAQPLCASKAEGERDQRLWSTDLRERCSFKSFFLGGFECSSHIRHDGTRLDMIAATCHDRFVQRDYNRLSAHGIQTCRDGVRWHRIEINPGRYDFSSLLPMLRAARHAGMQVIWDLCHYGWPDYLDIFDPEFIDRFAAFSRAATRVIRDESDGTTYLSPVNEISFLAWAGAEKGIINPFTKGRGHELKRQLVRASIAAIEAIREEVPEARLVQVDPLIHVVSEPWASRAEQKEAAAYSTSKFEGWDMLTGRICPELGGHPRYLDILGCNYYVHNQWVYGGEFIERTDPRYIPLHELLTQVYRRYNRPLFIAETGIEDDRRPEWLRYITEECLTAIELDIPVEGVCLYPVLNHPGWDDDRHCHNGLWDYCNSSGQRRIYRPLAAELRRQRARIDPSWPGQQPFSAAEATA